MTQFRATEAPESTYSSDRGQKNGKFTDVIAGSSNDFCKGRRMNVFDKHGNPTGCVGAPIYNPGLPKIGGIEDLDNIEYLNDDESDEEQESADNYVFEPLTEEEHTALSIILEAAMKKLTSYENSRINQILLVKSITRKDDTSGTTTPGVTLGRTIVLTPVELEETLFHESWHVIDKFIFGDNQKMKGELRGGVNGHNNGLKVIIRRQIEVRNEYLRRVRSYTEMTTESVDELYDAVLEERRQSELELLRTFKRRYIESNDTIQTALSNEAFMPDYLGEGWTALTEPAQGFFTEYSSHSPNEDQAEIWMGIQTHTYTNSRGETLFQAAKNDPLLKRKIEFMLNVKPSMTNEVLERYEEMAK